MKRTRIKHRSKKTSKIYREQRVPLVKQLLSEFPFCQRCRSNPATDVHEIKSRARGGSILDPDNLAVLCRPCHTFITVNPAQAKLEGWSKNSWDL